MGNTDSMCLCLGSENRKPIKMTPEEQAQIEEQYTKMLDLQKENANLQKILKEHNLDTKLEQRDKDGESTART